MYPIVAILRVGHMLYELEHCFIGTHLHFECSVLIQYGASQTAYYGFMFVQINLA